MSSHDLNKLVRDFVHPVEAVLNVAYTISEALALVRQQQIGDKIFYFYVVDDDNRLIGVVPARKLLIHDTEVSIAEVMETSVICLSGSHTLEEALQFLESHRLLALPVIDAERRLLGIIDVNLYLEESMDVASSRRRSDIFQMIGLYVDEGKKFQPWKSFRRRMPWIVCNMVGGFMCAGISRAYEHVLTEVILLAMFIPLLLTLSESISMQSMTQIIQLIIRKTYPWRYCLKLIGRECRVVLLLAVTSGLIVGGVSCLWGDGIMPGIVIGLAIMISISVSAAIGASIPLLLHIKNWDPKVAAGPVVLMFADVLTTAIYLTLGFWVLL